MRKQLTTWCDMFSRTEQNETERAVVAKLLAFKKILAERSSTNDLCRRFFLDVLAEILDEACNAIPLVFPLDKDERTAYDYHLYQQVDLFYLKNSDVLNADTIQKLFYKYDRTLPNANGIVLHQNNLYQIQFDKKRKVTDIQLIDNSFDAQAYIDLKSSILNETQSRCIYKETNLIADEAQRALIARILNTPNVKQSRGDEFMVVIKVIEKIEDCIQSKLESNRHFKSMALECALAFTIIGGGGLLLQNSVTLLVSYVVGKTIALAKLITLAYIVGGFITFILAITLSAALYCYLNERQCALQLTKLRGFVNQSKTYDLDDNTAVPDPESFNFEGISLRGAVKGKFFRDEENLKIGQFKIMFPSVGLFFSHNKPVFQAMASEFQPVPR